MGRSANTGLGRHGKGILPKGKKVVPAIYCNLVNKPGYSQARWYTPSNPPIKVRVPVELILHTSFEMARATAERPTPMQRSALAKGALVLAEDDHLQSMDALAWS